MGLSLSVEGGDPRWVAAAARFAGDCANRLGLNGALIEDATASACRNVTKHAYEAGEVIRYQVSVEEHEGSLVIGVCDQGLTFSLVQLENPVFQRLDSVRLQRLGKAGKRLELRMHLPERTVEELLTESDKAAVPEPPVSQADVSVRAAVPADAVGIARCIYRCYGRSYGSQYMYLPEKLKRMWEQGMLISVVAEPEGDIVGHLDYWMENAGDPAGQSTDAVVDPRFRGRHLFDQTKRLLVDVTRAAGKLGMISEAVTVHPFTQKGVLAAGGIETGLMLGDLPADLKFKKIEDQLPARQSCMLCYLRLNPEPEREIVLPTQHEDILRRIIAHVSLKRRTQADTGAPEGACELELHLDPGWGEGGLRVTRYGDDLGEVVRTQLHHVLASGYGYAFLELPLRAGVTAAVRAAEELGFSFSGLVPEGWQGDLLRMHYVKDLDVDPKIAVASDWGAELPRLRGPMRALTPEDRAWLRAEAPRLFGAQVVISRGVAHPVAELDGFLIPEEGLATFRCEGDQCELVTIDAFTPHRGVGTKLLAAVEEAARARGCRRLWLITTNDNLEALRFYQRRGYRLCARTRGAVDDVSRLLKPQIPRVGEFGIPLRDELELEKLL